MVFPGALLGLVFGLFSGFFLIGLVFPASIVAGPFAAVFALVTPLAAPFLALPWFVSAFIWYFLNVLVFWLLAIPTQASVVLPASIPGGLNPVPVTGWQNFYRGFGYGTAATINLALLLPFFVNPVLMIFGYLSVLPILAIIPAVRLSVFFQGIIAWLNWVLPTHWPGNVVGLLLYIGLFPFALATFGIGALRFDITSGTFEILAPLGGATAFNLAIFTYLNGSNPTIVPGPFLGANVSSHEVGHNMNSAFMTPFYSWGTVIEEFRVFGVATFNAIGQMTAESRGAPQTGNYYSPIWSP